MERDFIKAVVKIPDGITPGMLIGKGGKNFKRVRESYPRVKINVNDETWMDLKCEICGPPDEVDGAKVMFEV